MARRLPDASAIARPTRAAVSTEQELRQVFSAWEVSRAHSSQTDARMSESLHRFAARLQAQGVRTFIAVTAEQAASFVHAPLPDGRYPEVNTQHARRTAVRALYRTLRQLGYPVGDPTLDLVLVPREARVARPLTSAEVLLCRATAQATSGRAWIRAAAWALGESGAVSSEITRVRVCDLIDPANPEQVRLPGTRRARPRVVELTPWARQVLGRRLMSLRLSGRLRPGALLAYEGAAPPGGAKAQAAACNALRNVMEAAGLANDPDVRPASLRHWVGRSAYDAGASLDEVAALLGHRSLDATAADIALAPAKEASAR